MKDEMYEEMYRTDQFHWWFRAKREIVMGLAASCLSGSPGKKIIDFGCGCGMMLETMTPYGTVTGTDLSPLALAYCANRFTGELRQLDLSAPAEPWAAYDFGIALDLLEHIEDDAAAAKNILRFLRPGGQCIITVPAYQWLWSSHDENCMYKRRYTKKSLWALMSQAGFEIEYLSYYNTLLFPLAALVRSLSKLMPFDRASSVENNSWNPVVNSILYHIFRLEKGRICHGRTFPFGLSLIALVKRP